MSRRERAIELFMPHPPVAFSYQHASRSFAVGADTVDVAEILTHRPPLTAPISETEAAELVDTSKLLLLSGTWLCMMPTLSKQLLELSAPQRQALSDTLTDVMIDVYAETSDQPRDNLLKGELWGFGVNLSRPNLPDLHVVGECACYGASAVALFFGSRAWSEGFSQFDMQNVQWPQQKIALLAGAGSLALATDYL